MRHLRMNLDMTGTFLDLMDSLVNEVLLDEEPALFPWDTEDISLHDLFDMEIEPLQDDSEEIENARAVETFFPDSLLDIDLNCYESMPASPDSTADAPLATPTIDLTLDEDSPPSTPPQTVPATLSPIPEADEPVFVEMPQFELDNPKIPGINCKSCKYHRERLQKPFVCCSLCFMRLTTPYTFSKYMFLKVIQMNLFEMLVYNVLIFCF